MTMLVNIGERSESRVSISIYTKSTRKPLLFSLLVLNLIGKFDLVLFKERVESKVSISIYTKPTR